MTDDQKLDPEFDHERTEGPVAAPANVQKSDRPHAAASASKSGPLRAPRRATKKKASRIAAPLTSGGLPSKRELRPYPRKTLEDCVKIVEAIKTQNAGNPWPPDEIAKAIKIKSRSSNFSDVTRAAALYGLIDGSYRSSVISLTQLGKLLAYPQNDKELSRAQDEAFLSVEIFRKVVDHFSDRKIPASPFINNTLKREFSLPEEFHEEFLRILESNIAYVGGAGEKIFHAGRQDPPRAQIIENNISKQSSKTKLRAFVIMPFVERLNSTRPQGFFKEVDRAIIAPACDTAGFSAATADRHGSDIIQATILREILDADMIVADLTDHNPNVMFELGLRMAIAQKPVCIIKTKDTGRIFDVDNMLRVFEYSQNLWSSTVASDVPELVEHIKATWLARDTGSSYVEILTGRSGRTA